MKKTSALIIVVGFLISLFLISTQGGAIRDEQFKHYLQDVEITSFDDTFLAGEEEIKYKVINYSDADLDEGVYYYTIGYTISPEVTTEANPFEFTIVSGNGEFEVGEGETREYATLVNSRLAIYHECSLYIMMKSTDGSNLYDFCFFYFILTPSE